MGNVSRTAGVTDAMVMLNVRDLDRAVAFWREVMGLHQASRGDMVELLLPGSPEAGPRLLLHHAVGEWEGLPAALCFVVKDVREALERVEQGGGKIVKQPDAYPAIWHAVGADPDGNRFQLVQPRE